jgi:hypothetical protein
MYMVLLCAGELLFVFCALSSLQLAFVSFVRNNVNIVVAGAIPRP